MKRNLVTFGIVLVVLAGIALINGIEPERKTREREAAELKAADELALAEHAEHDHANDESEGATPVTPAVAASDGPGLDTEGLETFLVELECTNGNIVLEMHPEWGPLGVAQFVAALEDGVYDEAGFFRVLPGFVVQFGLPGDPEKAMKWGTKKIPDEPVTVGNTRGTITFAKSSAPNSRTTQMFINLGDNSRLDGMGFTVIGKVVEGMDVVDSINAEYGEKPVQIMITTRGNAYLKEFFPNLDYINKATVRLPDAPEGEE